MNWTPNEESKKLLFGRRDEVLYKGENLSKYFRSHIKWIPLLKNLKTLSIFIKLKLVNPILAYWSNMTRTSIEK